MHEQTQCAIRGFGQPGTPPQWLAYAGAEDVDEPPATAGRLDATKIPVPIDLQTAKTAVLSDPQGAAFALYAGQLEP